MPTLADTSLSEPERRAVERLVDLLEERFGADLLGVWLYGSRARGERPRAESDIDLMVITSGGRARDLDAVIGLAMDAAEAEGIGLAAISTRVADPAWIEDRRAIESFFMREVDRDKIVLAGHG